jgi:hypothetical protein
MALFERMRSKATGSGLRLVVSTLAVLLLPPFIAVAIVPLALLLFPVAWLAIPFIVPTLLGDALVGGAQPQPAKSQSPLARTKLIATAAISGARGH